MTSPRAAATSQNARDRGRGRQPGRSGCRAGSPPPTGSARPAAAAAGRGGQGVRVADPALAGGRGHEVRAGAGQGRLRGVADPGRAAGGRRRRRWPAAGRTAAACCPGRTRPGPGWSAGRAGPSTRPPPAAAPRARPPGRTRWPRRPRPARRAAPGAPAARPPRTPAAAPAVPGRRRAAIASFAASVADTGITRAIASPAARCARPAVRGTASAAPGPAVSGTAARTTVVMVVPSFRSGAGLDFGQRDACEAGDMRGVRGRRRKPLAADGCPGQ